MELMRCEDVSIYYDKVAAIENVSFCVDEGDYLFVLGENGAGKSTLMNALLGLLPIQHGNITYENLSPKEIGYLPQQTVVQKDFPASVMEVVLSGCLNSTRFFPFYTKQDREKALQKIEQLGISHLQKRCYRELSGGQQQRVLLARALCATSKLLILDEPVAGLDPLVTNEMYELVKKLNKNDGITVIMISHDIKSAITYGNKVLQLQRKTLFFGDTEAYAQSEIGNHMIGGHCG